ncbi:unnamed protein product [Parnassius apollo]|uniref:(apollo) hypothetical protein n=1 Tax=Parnassius apollo TaxID=110799 RepID=A0A8S3XB98_PARAO|nr:unnamed protein product [Parnassius apollo]
MTGAKDVKTVVYRNIIAPTIEAMTGTKGVKTVVYRNISTPTIKAMTGAKDARDCDDDNTDKASKPIHYDLKSILRNENNYKNARPTSAIETLPSSLWLL